MWSTQPHQPPGSGCRPGLSGLLLRSVIAILCLLPAGASWQELSAQAGVGTATLKGSVLIDPSEKPIPDAQIELNAQTGGGGNKAISPVRSDSSGIFVLAELHEGRYRMIVRAVGFQTLTVDIDVPSAGLDGVDVLLQPASTTALLPGVNVKAASGMRSFMLNAFDERRKLGTGQFLDSTTLIAGGDGKRWASVIAERISGVRLISYGGRRSFASTRGMISFEKTPRGDSMDRQQGAPAGCYVQVIIDGIQRYGSRMEEPLLDVSGLSGPFVAAEYYSVSQTPSQFNRSGNAPCGTLVLWTGS